MKNIRAVFWDIDGTIVMSEPIHDEKMRHIARANGVALTEEIIASFQGIGDPGVYEIMKRLGYGGRLKDFMQECDDYYFASMEVLEVREGFADAFKFFEDRGIYQSAVSNGTKPLVEANLKHAGIAEKLTAVVDLDDVAQKGLIPKPAADPYLEALRIVNEKTGGDISPQECLVIEDSPTGIRAGKSAGMTAIFWMLEPGRTAEGADYSAFTGQDLIDIISPFFGKRLSA